MRRLLTAIMTAVVVASLFPLSVFAGDPQTINWDVSLFPATTYGDAAFDVSSYVSATSGLPVNLSSTTAGVCSIAGSTVTIHAAGTCTILAAQAGDSTWDPAVSVPQDFAIGKATVTVTAVDKSITFGQADPAFTFTYGAFQYSDNSSVINTPPTCDVAGAHTAVSGSPYTIACSGGADPSYAFSYVDGHLTISKATPVVNAVGGTFPYTGSSHAGSGTATGAASEDLTPVAITYDGTGATTYGPTAAAPTSVGTYQVTAAYAGNSNYDAAQDTAALTITIASQTITWDLTGFTARTFGDTPFDVSPYATASSGLTVDFTSTTGTICTAGGSHGATVTILKAGTCTIRAAQAGDANHSAAAPVNHSFTIAKAAPDCAVTGYTVTYDGLSHTATGSCLGVDGITVLAGLVVSGTTHTAAGNHAADPWTFTDVTGNYSNDSGTVADSIGKFTTVVTATGTSVTYNGSAHGGTGTATGVGGAPLLPVTLSYAGTGGTTYGPSATAPTHAGTYQVTATYAGSTDYAAGSDTAPITIAKADPTCVITGYTVTFDNIAHTASGTCKGVDGITVLGGLDKSATTHTNAVNHPADPWTFTDATGDYNDASGTVPDVINAANAACTFTTYSVAYDGLPHTATGSCVGIDGTTVLDGLVISSTHTNAGSYPADSWTFTDVTGNYNDDAGTITDVISKIDAVCTITPYAVVYDGSPHTATGSCVGLDGVTPLGVLDLTATTHANAGDYSGDTWAFNDNTGNYTDQGGTSADSIAKADQAITFTSIPPDAPAINATYSPTATSDSGLPVTLSIDSATSATCSIAGGVVTFHLRGTCTIDGDQAGNGNWNAAPTKQQGVGVLDVRPVCPDDAIGAVMHVATPGTITCTDFESDPITYAVLNQGAHGTASINAATGAWTYTSVATFTGTDTFQLVANDGVVDSLPATVTVTITNHADDAFNDVFSVAAAGASVVPVTANDSAGVGDTGQPLTVTAVTQGSKGRVTANGASVVYDPSGCSTGSDLFTYTVSDGLTTDTAAVIVTIVRPGQKVTAPAAGTLSRNPIADAPSLWFVTGSTMSSTMPMRLGWCGVFASGAKVKTYRVYQSLNGGSTFSSSAIVTSKATSSTRSLSIGSHYAWRLRVADSAGRTGGYGGKTIDSLTRYQDSSGSITYSSGWKTAKSSSYSSGSEHTATSTGATATLTLNGVRGFAIVGSKGTGRGSVRVFVDGTLVATISEKTTKTHYRVVLYARSISSGASHIIVIRPAGNGRIDLDAIVALT